MPRILFTVINDLTYDQRMHRICSSLAGDGHDVLLIGRTLRTSLPPDPKPFRQVRMNLLFTRGKLFYVEHNIRLFLLLLFTGFDVVCGIDLDTILPCYFAARLKGKKCVYDAHEIFSEVPEVTRRPSVQKIWKRVERFAVRRIRNCYTVSNGLADYFYEHYQRRFEVIRNVPLKGETSPADDDPQTAPVILYQGALNEGRGLEWVIAAMEHLDGQLILVGDGDLSAALRSLVTDQHLQDKVIFAGMKKSGELAMLTRQARIGINLLENTGLNYFHSLANKFFDYVMAGLPQITMDFPEYRAMNAEYEVAVLIADLKVETIVAAAHKLLHEKDFYFRLRQNCLHARDVWNWEKEEPRLLSFYRQLK
jgi:glycosyltransferase involved in cell wall biosynthesis